MDNELSKTIGKRINTLLAEKKKKQKELAAHLCVPDNTISYFVSGRRTPNTEQISKIADFFDVSADYLLGRTNAKTTDKDLRFVCEYTGLNEDAIQMLIYTVHGELVTKYGVLKKMIAGKDQPVDYSSYINYIFESQFLYHLCEYIGTFSECTFAINSFYTKEIMKKIYNEDIEKYRKAIKKEKEIIRDTKLSLFEASRATEQLLNDLANKVIKEREHNGNDQQT